MHSHCAPARQSREQTIDGGLQHRRVVAQMRGLAEGLVDHRVERDNPPGELSSLLLGIVEIGSRHRQRAGKSAGDLGRDGGEQGRQPAGGAAEIRSGENDAGRNDADADFAGPVDRNQKGCIAIHATGGSEQVAGDDRYRIPGQRRRIGREVAQQRGRKGASRPPQCQTAEEQGAILWEAGRQQHAHYGAD
jgi:hypothetical protein